MSLALEILTFVAAIGAGVTGGIFYAFSSFVMSALRRLPKTQGVAAMQAINITVLTPSFFLAFFGTAIVCLVVAALASPGAAGSCRIYLMVGSATYLIGCILVTGMCNVPLNNRLAVVDPGDEGWEELWDLYLSRWTSWNHVRTGACIVATALFVLALWEGVGN